MIRVLAVLAALSLPGPAAAGPCLNWTNRNNMPTPRESVAVAAAGGLVYAAGGGAGGSFTGSKTFESYDPVTTGWAARPDLPVALYAASAIGVGGTVYVIGGADSWNGTVVDTVYAYDPATGSWNSGLKAMPGGARAYAAVAAIGTTIYVMGGADPINSAATNRVEAYDTATDTWTTLSSAGFTAREAAAAGVVGGIVYVAGGGVAYGSPQSTFEAYDPATDTWSTLPSMPTARIGAAGAVTGSLFYVTGGDTTGAGAYSKAVESYDPGGGGWSAESSLNTPRGTHGLVETGGRLIAAGGYNGGEVAKTEEGAFTGFVASFEIKATGPLSKGEHVQVRWTATNTGRTTLFGVKPSLLIFSGTFFVTSFSGPVPSGGQTMTPGKVQDFVWTFSVDGGPATVELSTTLAGATSPNACPATVSTTGFFDTLPGRAKFSTSLSVMPNPAYVGQVMNVSLNVTNLGEVDAKGVVPSIIFPTGSSLVAVRSGPSPPGPLTITPGAKGAVAFFWTLSATGEGVVEVTASATGTDDYARSVANGATVSRSILRPATLETALSIVPNPAFLGTWVDAVLTVTNTGQANAMSVVGSMAATTSTTFLVPIADPGMTGFLILPGASRSYTWTYSISGGVPVTLTGTASGTDSGASQPIAGSASGVLSVTTPARLTSTLWFSPSPVYIGQPFTINLTVSNTGGFRADNVFPYHDLNAGSSKVAFVSGPVPAGPVTIQPGSSTTFRWSYSMTGVGALAVTATAFGDDGTGGKETTASTAVQTLLDSARLFPSLTVSPPAADPGEWVTLTLNVNNLGDAAVTGALPSLALNSGAGHVTVVAGPAPAGPLTVPAGGNQAFSWTVSVSGEVNASFTASLTGTDAGLGTPVSAGASAKLVADFPILKAAAVVTPSVAQSGNWFRVAVSLTNTGGVTATGVLPVFGFRAGAGFVTQLAAPSPPQPPGFFTVTPGGTRELVWTFSASGLGAVAFSVTVEGVDAVTAEPVRVVVAGGFTVATPAVLSAGVSPGATVVFVGRTVGIGLTVTNTGGADATNVSLSYTDGTTAVPLASGITIPAGTSTGYVVSYGPSTAGTVAVTLNAVGLDGISATVTAAATGTFDAVWSGFITGTLTVSPWPTVGQRFQATLRVENLGGAPVTGLVPALGVPLGAAAVSLVDGPRPAGPLTLPGGSVTRFVWTFDAVASADMIFSATASGWDAVFPVIERTAFDTEMFGIADPASLVAALAVDATVVREGSEFDVVLTVTNTGDNRAWTVTPSGDAGPSVPALVELVSGPAPSGTPWIPPGDRATFTWTYRALGGGTVLFNAGAGGTESVLLTPLAAAAASPSLFINSSAVLAAQAAVVSSPVREGATFEVRMTVSNTGSIGAGSLVPVLSPSLPGFVRIESGPSPSLASPATGSGTTFVWVLRAVGSPGGPLGIAVSVAGVDLLDGSPVTAGAAAAVTIIPRPEGELAPYPNPALGDRVRLSLRLASHANEVHVDAFDPSGHRVYRGRWVNVSRDDGTVEVDGLGGWAPGVYLLRVRAVLDNGGEQVFPVAKLVVK